MKLSVLIGTCDAYEPLWEPFQITFDRYWKFPTQNLFVGETKVIPNYTDTKFDTIALGKKSWGSRMRDGVIACKEEYIFFVLEDYFFNYSYDETQMNTWIEDMKKYDMNRLQVCGPPGEQRYMDKENCPYKIFQPNSRYIISVQPSIWKKSYLLEVLKDEYSPWDFELKGSALLLGTDHKTYADASIPTTYFNAVRIGFKKSVGWEAFRDSEGLKDF